MLQKNMKNKIDVDLIKRLIKEDLLYFIIASQISSDNIVEKKTLEQRLQVIQSIKAIINDLSIENKEKYLILLDKGEKILIEDLNNIFLKKE